MLYCLELYVTHYKMSLVHHAAVLSGPLGVHFTMQNHRLTSGKRAWRSFWTPDHTFSIEFSLKSTPIEPLTLEARLERETK